MIQRQHVVNDFFAEAEAMRSAYDLKVKDPYRQTVSWQYFCAPQMYTYLRTVPQQVIPEPLFARFMQHMKQWCIEHVGLLPMGVPNLHLMVNGCTLGLHSDFQNGTLGYVYSLTRWQTRKFAGGETLLLRDGIPSYKKHHVQGESLYELVPAQFNQLLLFDDRIVHGTQTIEGSMDPLEGRIAFVGHLRPTSPVVKGALDAAAARRVILDLQRDLAGQLKDREDCKDVQGTVTFRLEVGASGQVESVTVLIDHLVTAAAGYAASAPVDEVRRIVQQGIAALKFPDGAGKSTVTAAVLVPLPDLRPIEIAVPHAGRAAMLREVLRAQLKELEAQGFQIEQAGDEFLMREPLAGTIRIEATRIVAAFDPPMWVPSQREHFQANLRDSLGMLARAGG
ncbi:hypothetical protein [Massilia sp. YMA4]|uniref:hypothetical protein n=1 Tax=Massilia sp. YMA4 TaxID=1593482 RepID=UPI000DD1701A|nr:hypothetical protein [Massilia sp. YMA4]AXA91298.1 hypothetical protein DPH57_09125 [Massilia sp. YMA4]